MAERVFRDHHRFRLATSRVWRSRRELWVTTEKDAVKLLPSWVGEARVVVLVIELEVEEPEALLDWIEARLRGTA